MSYRDFMRDLAPGFLQEPWGRARQAAIGELLDQAAEEGDAALKMRFPTLAPHDGITRLGDERGIPKNANASLDEWRLRVRAAWDIWSKAGTPDGMLQAFRLAGYPRVILCTASGWQHQLDANGVIVNTVLPAWSFLTSLTPGWAEFVVIFDEVNFQVWGAGPPAADSIEADGIRSLIRQQAPATALCRDIVIITAGHVWDYPGDTTWTNQGGTWSGHTVTHWTP